MSDTLIFVLAVLAVCALVRSVEVAANASRRRNDRALTAAIDRVERLLDRLDPPPGEDRR